MRFVPTRIHGVIDYLTGLLLILSPWLFGFADGGIKQWLPVALGVLIIGQSLITDYEMSMVHILPLPADLVMDGLSGAVLAVSPWLFGFADVVWLPRLLSLAEVHEIHR